MTVVQGRPRMAMMIGSVVRRLTECDEIADRQPWIRGAVGVAADCAPE